SIFIFEKTNSRGATECTSPRRYTQRFERQTETCECTRNAHPRGLLLHARLDRVLDVLDLVDLDIEQLPGDFFDTTDIDRLDDVARIGVDRDRAARALPLHSLGGRDQRVAVGLAARLLQGFVDQVHAVPAADRIDVWIAPVGRFVRRDELGV